MWEDHEKHETNLDTMFHHELKWLLQRLLEMDIVLDACENHQEQDSTHCNIVLEMAQQPIRLFPL